MELQTFRRLLFCLVIGCYHADAALLLRVVLILFYACGRATCHAPYAGIGAAFGGQLQFTILIVRYFSFQGELTIIWICLVLASTHAIRFEAYRMKYKLPAQVAKSKNMTPYLCLPKRVCNPSDFRTVCSLQVCAYTRPQIQHNTRRTSLMNMIIN